MAAAAAAAAADLVKALAAVNLTGCRAGEAINTNRFAEEWERNCFLASAKFRQN